MVDQADAAFACRLLAALGSGRNVFFSPASVRAAFSLLFAGARGRTADEMKQALSFGAWTEASVRFARVLRAIEATSAGPAVPGNAPDHLRAAAERRRVVLRLVNRIWSAAGRPVLPAFERVAAESFGAPVEPLDFARDAEGCRRHINAWVERATEQKIRDLLAPEQVSPETGLAVASAAYVRGRWVAPFKEPVTRPAPFFAPAGRVTVPLMEQMAHHPYGERPDVQLAELAYGSGEVVMRLAVPRDPNGLAAIEPRAPELLAEPLRSTRVHLWLPRFRMSTRCSLDAPLVAMGMPSVFQRRTADFSGIDGTRELFVSAAVHQAFVDVDENGTEAAAAATALFAVAGAAMVRAQPVELRVDRPFLFWILHEPTGSVLFAGRVVDPSR